MKIAVISGSHRKTSNSIEVARWVGNTVSELECETDIFDLSQIELPFWSEENWNSNSEAARQWKPYSERLAACYAIVIVSPEWAGMMPPMLGNFLLLCSAQELSYKPCLLIGVSAGASGTYPIAQLRMSASKNNQMIYLPDHLIIRNVGTFLRPQSELAKESVLDEDGHLNSRLRYNLHVLCTLGRDLKALRQKLDIKKYPYGL